MDLQNYRWRVNVLGRGNGALELRGPHADVVDVHAVDLVGQPPGVLLAPVLSRKTHTPNHAKTLKNDKIN